MRVARMLIGLALCATAATSQSAESTPGTTPALKKYVVPKTEFGHPELRGVWNYSSDTPLERPAQYKDREFLTPAEVTARRQELQKQVDALDGATFNSVGGHNMFWMDSFAQGDHPRTSL